ncbi:MAG: FKBP-type peptidyl-prolyl cis-trans isomerase [Francisellaceae bacterium]
MKKISALLASALLAGSISAYAADASTTTTTEPAKAMAAKHVSMNDVSYIIGYEMGKGFKEQGMDLDVKSLEAGASTGLSGKDAKFSEAEMKTMMQSFQQEMIQKAQAKLQAESSVNEKTSVSFMKAVEKIPGIVKASDGVYYQVITKGKGTVPSKEDTVTVNYTGSTPAKAFSESKDGMAQLEKGELLGKVFDSSDKTGKPATLPLNQVIPCWSDALSQIPVGSTVILYCAPAQAYGEMAPPMIGPNQALSFKVELISAKPPAKAAAEKDKASDSK